MDVIAASIPRLYLVPLAPMPVQHLLRRRWVAHAGDDSHRARHHRVQHSSAASVGIQHGRGQAGFLAGGCRRERRGGELNRIAIDETEVPIRVCGALADPVYRSGNILIMASTDSVEEGRRRWGTAGSPRTTHKGSKRRIGQQFGCLRKVYRCRQCLRYAVLCGRRRKDLYLIDEFRVLEGTVGRDFHHEEVGPHTTCPGRVERADIYRRSRRRRRWIWRYNRCGIIRGHRVCLNAENVRSGTIPVPATDATTATDTTGATTTTATDTTGATTNTTTDTTGATTNTTTDTTDTARIATAAYDRLLTGENRCDLILIGLSRCKARI